MTTPDTADFNSVVERVALLAFFEVVSGGVILVGDLVEIGGRRVGVVAGFNDTHMPNHQNICLSAIELLDGESRGLSCGDVVRFFSGQSAARSAPGS